MNLLGVFGGGLWIIPLILILGSAWFFYVGYRAWKSGTAGWTWIGNTPKWVESDKRAPFFSVGQVIFGLILFVAFIVTVILMVGDK